MPENKDIRKVSKFVRFWYDPSMEWRQCGLVDPLSEQPIEFANLLFSQFSVPGAYLLKARIAVKVFDLQFRDDKAAMKEGYSLESFRIGERSFHLYTRFKYDPAHEWRKLEATHPVNHKQVELAEMVKPVLKQPGSYLIRINTFATVLDSAIDTEQAPAVAEPIAEVQAAEVEAA